MLGWYGIGSDPPEIVACYGGPGADLGDQHRCRAGARPVGVVPHKTFGLVADQALIRGLGLIARARYMASIAAPVKPPKPT